MKKKICLFLAFCAVLLLPLSVTARADYSYTIRVFAGNMGTIDGAKVVEQSDLPYGAEWSFDIDRVEVTNPKYYVRGIRESGRDNDTVSGAAFRVTRDMDFVVAYGVRGSEVAYTAHFVRDSDGKQLAPSVTYYGNVGDKPVVACKFIEGYYPRYYNITGTLQENAAANVFEFRYAPAATVSVKASPTPVPAPTADPFAPFEYPQNQQTNEPIDPRPNVPQNAPATAAPAAPAVTAAPQDTFPPSPEEILDMDVPLVGPEDDAPEAEPGRDAVPIIIGIIAAVSALLAVIVLFLRKKNKEK